MDSLQTILHQVPQWIIAHPMYANTAFASMAALGLGVRALKHRVRALPGGHGTAAFGSKSDLHAADLFRPDGVVVGHAYGHHLRSGPDRHVLVIGPSGSGKTVLIRKTLETLRESVVCLDLKGSLTTDTAVTRRRYGPVYIFDPVKGGDHLNPWSLIRWGSTREVSDIQRMVDHLTDSGTNVRTNAELYYLSQAQESLWATIPYLYYSGIEEASMGGLRTFYAASGAAIKERVTGMLESGHKTVRDWSKQVQHTPNAALDAIWTSARTWLRAWVNPTLCWNTHDTTIDLRELQQTPYPSTLYLRINVEDIQGPLSSFTPMLIDMLSLWLCDRDEDAYEHTVTWVMDDLSELRRFEFLLNLTAYLRGFGHQLLGGSQAFGQLWERFTRDTAILNNTKVWVLFPPMDPKEAEVISSKLGEMTMQEPVDTVTRSWGRRSRSYSVRTYQRALMTPDEVGRLRQDQMIVCVYGSPPFVVSRGPLRMEMAA